VPLDGPVELCKVYGMNVLFNLKPTVSHAANQDLSNIIMPKNAFSILMESSKEKGLPKRKEGENLNGYQRLHNEVLQVLETLNVGWSPYSVDTIGASYLSQLVASLWYLDTHHETLADRGLHLPKELAHLHGFNQWQKKKIKKPQMTVEGLEDHIRNLCHFTSQPWLSKSQYSVLKVITEALSNIMYNYKEYLLKQRDCIQERHQRVEPSRSAIENVEMRTYEAQIGPVSKSYCHLFKYMETLEFYEEVCLDKFSPEERYTGLIGFHYHSQL